MLGGTLMDYFVPTMVETPVWETDYTVTPSPHHPIGAKGVAESPHVGSIPCFTAAVVDAFSPLGVTHINMPSPTPIDSGNNRTPSDWTGTAHESRTGKNRSPCPEAPMSCGVSYKI